MGCFETLPVPWKKAVDLSGDAAGAHLEENFRLLEQWANPLNMDDDCGGGCPDVASAASAYFSGTVTAANTIYFNDDYGSPTTDLSGGMEYDSATGIYTPPRDAFYTITMHAQIEGSGLPDPYWVQLIAEGATTQQLAPYATSLPYAMTMTVYVTAGFPIVAGIFNNVTATDDIDFDLASVWIVEIPCSTQEA